MNAESEALGEATRQARTTTRLRLGSAQETNCLSEVPLRRGERRISGRMRDFLCGSEA